jgi:hypothetical protein
MERAEQLLSAATASQLGMPNVTTDVVPMRPK